MIYAVDFDGTLCTNKYPQIGSPNTKVIEYLKDKQSNGDKLILWTCRSGDNLTAAVDWCKERGLVFDAVDKPLDESIKKYGSDPRKICADIYLDDKAMNITEIKEGRSMPLKLNEREYRAMPVLIPADNKRLDTEHYVEGSASTMGAPYELYEYDGIKYFEMIEPNAFQSADMSDVIMQYDHEGRVLARQRNGTLIVEPQGSQLFVAADLSKSNAAKDLYNDIKAGLIDKMSFAFVVDEDEYNQKTHTRTIKRIRKVYDVSAVSMPANSSTDISARSYAEGRYEAERQELAARQNLIKKLKLKITMEEIK